MLHRWKPIPRFPGYWASSGGLIRGPRGFLKQRAERGYRWVKLRGRLRRVHQLVAEAWIGPRPPRMTTTRHLNDIKHDNRRLNIAYGTDQDNADDRRGYGLDVAGKRV